MKHDFESAPARCEVLNPEFTLCSVKDQVLDFLEGKTHGEALLHALYDHVLDEPIPNRMRALLHR